MRYGELQERMRLDREIAENRELLLSGRLFGDAAEAARNHQVALHEKLEGLVAGDGAASTGAAELPPEVAKLTSKEAAERAAGIRARPELWNPDWTLKDGQPVITREQHQVLKAELVQLDARALAGDAGDAGSP